MKKEVQVEQNWESRKRTEESMLTGAALLLSMQLHTNPRSCTAARPVVLCKLAETACLKSRRVASSSPYYSEAPQCSTAITPVPMPHQLVHHRVQGRPCLKSRRLASSSSQMLQGVGGRHASTCGMHGAHWGVEDGLLAPQQLGGMIARGATRAV